ncbi:hypothetical protein ACGFIJ_29930 [Microbispora bryophytorum]|uniref:hypothetical protein n=1 Tax=Microbispora bryophytorum TaxID=1460882 RepID=UPI0037244CEF
MNASNVIVLTRAALTLPALDVVETTEQLPPSTDERWRVCLFEQDGHVRLYLAVPPEQLWRAAEFVADALAASGLRAVPAEWPDADGGRTADVLLTGTGQIIEGRDPEQDEEQAETAAAAA